MWCFSFEVSEDEKAANVSYLKVESFWGGKNPFVEVAGFDVTGLEMFIMNFQNVASKSSGCHQLISAIQTKTKY